MISVVGLSVGATLAAHGPLLGVNDRLSAIATGLPPSIDTALGAPRWAGIGISLVVIAIVLAGSPPLPRRSGSWSWGLTGVALGAVGVLAWVTGSWTGWSWGLSITGPSRSLLESTVLGMPSAVGWGTGMVVGIPLGAWLSARARGAIPWRRPTGPDTIRRFAGGALMGIGGTMAAGCNIGNALTGLSVLALNSVLATAAIVGGAAVVTGATGMRDPSPGFHVAREK